MARHTTFQNNFFWDIRNTTTRYKVPHQHTKLMSWNKERLIKYAIFNFMKL